MADDVRAADPTADQLGLTVRTQGDRASLVGCLVSVRHKRVANAAMPDTETRIGLGAPGDHRISARFNAIASTGANCRAFAGLEHRDRACSLTSCSLPRGHG
jgi:hypothetical protein